MHTLIGYNYRHSSTSSTKWLHLVEYKASCQCRWAAIWGKQDQARNGGTKTVLTNTSNRSIYNVSY